MHYTSPAFLNCLHLPLHLRWHSSKAPGLGKGFSASCWCPEAASEGDTTEETGGIPKPGGTVNPGTAAPPEAGGGGLGELAAKTLPILTESKQISMTDSIQTKTKHTLLPVMWNLTLMSTMGAPLTFHKA